MAKKKPKQVKIYFCPKCRSKDVRFIFSWKNLVGILPRMKCFGCGFEAGGFRLLVFDKIKLDELNKKVRRGK